MKLETLKDYVQSANINFLIGSGLSRPFLPTLGNIEGDIDTFTNNVWNALNEDNKVSLFTRFIDIETGQSESRIINKNK